MKNEDPVHGAGNRRRKLVTFRRDAEGHMQEIFRIGQFIVRIDKRLADRIFIRHRRNCRHFGDQSVAGDHALFWVGNVGAVVIKGGQGANNADHHGHWMRIAPKTAIKLGQLLMQHGVIGNIVGEFVLFRLIWQFAFQKQIADFHKVAFFRQLFNLVAAVHEHTSVSINIGDSGIARGC